MAKMKRYLQVKRKFDAAHRLESYAGNCERLHGHTWTIVAKFELPGELPSDTSMWVDFKDLKELIDSALPDHFYLNEFYEVSDPTAEFLSTIIFDDIVQGMRQSEIYFTFQHIKLVSVEVWESPDCCAIFSLTD